MMLAAPIGVPSDVMLDEHAILLALQETDLGVHQAIMARELVHNLRHPDGCDLPAELDETHVWVHGTAGDEATEEGWLSRPHNQVAGVLID
jgi:hypothetical protein